MKITQNEVGQPMKVVMSPLVGKVVGNGLVEFDLETLYKAQPELALGLIRKMKGEPDNEWRCWHPFTGDTQCDSWASGH